MILQAMEANTKIMEKQMNVINENVCRMEKKMDGMNANMKNEMEANTKRMEANTNGMKDKMREMRGEMRQMGQCLQASIMAMPRAATNELGRSATAVRPAVAAGEDRVIRETCWVRSVKVTETVTQK